MKTGDYHRKQSVLVQVGHSLPGPPFSSASLAINCSHRSVYHQLWSVGRCHSRGGESRLRGNDWCSSACWWLHQIPPDLCSIFIQCECNVLKRIILLHTCVLYIGDTTLIKSLWYKLISNQMCLGNKSFCIVYKTQLYITGISAFWTQIKKMSQNKSIAHSLASMVEWSSLTMAWMTD